MAEPPVAGRKIASPPIALVAALPLVIALLVHWAWRFDGLYGQDAHEYARYAGAVRGWLLGGPPPGWHAWGPGYGLTGALLGLVTGKAGASLQFLSALSLGAAVLATDAILRRLAPTTSAASRAAYLLVALALAPAMLVAGVLAMSDMLGIACTMAALALWLHLREAPDGRRVAAFVLVAGFAVITRYATILLLILPALDLLRLLLAGRRFGLIAIGALPALLVLAIDIAIKGGSATELFHHYSLVEWDLTNWFGRDTATADGIQHYPLPNLAFVLTALLRPAHLPLLLLLPFVRPRDFSGHPARVIAASALLYLLFVAGIPFQSMRFLLPLHPLALILLFPAWQRLWALPPRAVLAAGLLWIGAVQLWQAQRGLVPLVARNHWEQQVAAALRGYGQQPLYLFDLDPALRTRGIPQPMINLWLRPIDRFQPGALILFNPEGLQRQWAGRDPMLNWERAARDNRLEPIADLGQGWRLYRIHPRADAHR